jgi:hypothetical protein
LRQRTWLLALLISLTIAAGACVFGGGGDDGPDAPPTPTTPSAEDALGQWVSENRSVGFIPSCGDARPGVDVGKLCSTLVGERGPRRAYALGPTFSEPTALAFVEDSADGWIVLSVNNRDPSRPQVPGIDWPLVVGDAVVFVGLGEGECLSIREQPTQEAMRVDCRPDGTTAIIQEGPVDAETITWWRVAGEGFTGWAAGTWMRLPEAIAQALNPPTPTPAAD